MTIKDISTVEVGNAVREMAEEAERAARDAVEASILEVTRAAETARINSQEAIAQVEAVNKSVREMAEEVMRTAAERAEAAQAISEQAINRAEEFSKSAKERLEKAATAAGQSADRAIREAREAGETARAALNQAVSRSEEINNLAKELAEEATRSALEAVESAKRAFHESLAKSMIRSEEAKKLRNYEGKQVEAEEPLDKKGKAVDLQEKEQETVRDGDRGISGAARTKSRNAAEEPVSKEGTPVINSSQQPPQARIASTAPKTEPARRAPWISAISNSLRKSQDKNSESEETQSLEGTPPGTEPGNPATGVTLKTSPGDMDELFKGLVRIGIASGSSVERLRDFENQLRDIDDLKVLWICGSEDGGTSIVVSLRKPTALINTLNEFSAVESVGKEGETVTVALKKQPAV